MIQLARVQKLVDQRVAIEIESLTMRPGEISALIGPEGSGKDVLFRLLIGRERPSAGKVQVAGVDPFAQREEFGRRVGVVFAEDTLYQNRSPAGNLSFYARLRGLPGKRVAETLALVGLADQADIRVQKLSPSLLRRLAFGLALLHQPPVYIIDEPLARCDEATGSLLADLLREQADRGATVCMLAGSRERLTSLCDALYFLEQGQIAGVLRPGEEQDRTIPFMVPVKMEDSVALVNPGEILYVEAGDGRAVLFTRSGPLPTQYKLVELEARLARSGFFRAHRSYLVNLQHVREVISYSRSSFALKLADEAGTKIPLSKDAARELRALLDY